MRRKLFTFLMYTMFLSVFKIGAQGENEKLLVNENFQGWEAVSSSTTETSVTKKTDFSNETLIYKLMEIQASPLGWAADRFNSEVASVGYLMAAKTATPYIELSPLASITKVQFVHGATGGNRGYQLWKKVGEGDWVSVSNAYANPASGTLVTVDINEENVSLKFTNLTSSQNAYLFDLKIWGNYKSSFPQVDLITSMNITDAGTITRSIVSDTYDQGTVLTLTAKANFGYKFMKWTDVSGNELSSNASYEVTLDTDKNIIAVFESVATFSFNVTVEGSRWGVVKLSPEAVNGKYEDGTIVTANVVANPVTTFSFWEDGSSDTSRQFLVDGDKNITATFDEIPFIVGWDFVTQEPRSGRAADYYSESVNMGLMNMHKPDGSTVNWLANVGSFSPLYPCIRKWTLEADFDTEQRYYQASFSTEGYSNIHVKSMMGGNYQVHNKQIMQYSIDGIEFHNLTTVDIGAVYNSGWVDCNAALPQEAENQSKIYIRWIADVTSAKTGTGNDGTALTNIFIYGDKTPVEDEIPPVLISTSPSEGSSIASINGSIVLTFDEKVQAGEGNITLDGKVLTGTFGSKTATFKYSGLTYNTEYTFVVPAGALTDIWGNEYEGIILKFTTMNRQPPITKLYDAIIASDGTGNYATVQDAINAVPNDRNAPYLIFIKDGKYTGHVEIPANKPFVHLIGQSKEGVIISDNRLSGDAGDGSPVYHVSLGATVVVNSANCYFENITFENSWGYEKQAGPQALAMYSNNDKIAFRNCIMRSYQDTYLTSTKNVTDRHYLSDCRIEGAVDYIYGGGDVFFDNCTLFNVRPSGGYIVAPSHLTTTAWGYVFSNCTLDGNPGVVTYLGRPWHNSPKTVFLNSVCTIDIYAVGWYYKMGAIPAIFADYGTINKYGEPMDLSQRIEDYEYDVKDGNGNVIEVVKGKAKKSLTNEEASQYTYENVLQGADNWNPKSLFESVSKPLNVLISNAGIISWDACDYAISYIIYKDGKVIGFTTSTSFNSIGIQSESVNETPQYTVQPVNEYGSLGEMSDVAEPALSFEKNEISQKVPVIINEGMSLLIKDIDTGTAIKVYTIDGRLVSQSVLNADSAIIPLSSRGIYVIKIGTASYKVAL